MGSDPGLSANDASEAAAHHKNELNKPEPQREVYPGRASRSTSYGDKAHETTPPGSDPNPDAVLTTFGLEVTGDDYR